MEDNILNILVTGANGFVGKNLVETFKCIRDNKKTDTNITISQIYEYDRNNTTEDLDKHHRTFITMSLKGI